MMLDFECGEIKLLSEFIVDKYGLSFEGVRLDILKSRLRSRLKETACYSYYDYYRYLKSHPNARHEFLELEQTLTNNETFFFRERHQMEALKHLLELPTSTFNMPLRALSIGCSSGEEAYSLAMLLAPYQVQITAFDLNAKRIAQARTGKYGVRAIRNCLLAETQKYFTSHSDIFIVKPEYVGQVEFHHRNVMDSSWINECEGVDVVFCRNMFIYFGTQAFMRTVENIHRVLKPQGLLFLGHSESLIGKSELFAPEVSQSTVYYRKVGK